MKRNLTAFLAAFLTTAVCAASAGAHTEADLQGANPPANGLWVDSLDLSRVDQEWGEPRAGRSVDNRPLTLRGDVFRHGVGTHANSEWLIDLKGAATRFAAVVGVDDEKKGLGSVRFHVFVDGKPAAETGVLHGGDSPKLLSVDLTGAKTLRLQVDDADDGIDSDHADWAGAVLVLNPDGKDKPQTAEPPKAPTPDVGPVAGPKPAIRYPRRRRRHARPAFSVPHPGHRRRAALAFTAENLLRRHKRSMKRPGVLFLDHRAQGEAGKTAVENHRERAGRCRHHHAQHRRRRTQARPDRRRWAWNSMERLGLAARWTPTRSARRPTPWSRAASPPTASSTSTSTTPGKASATPPASSMSTTSSRT